MKLLAREEFRKGITARERGVCCVPGCCASAEDAGHMWESTFATLDIEKS